MAKKWYYNSNSGVLGNYNELTEWPALHMGTGWHGPFDTKQAAIDYYTRNASKNSGWKAPTDSLSKGASNAVSTIGDKAVGGLGLSDDEIRSWLVRIGEILLGVVLVGVGVAKLTGTTNVVASAVKARI